MSQNPYLAEITQLTTAIIDLQMELATAAGADRQVFQQELAAKTAVANKLQGLSDAWRLGRITQAVGALQDLAASELAKQGRVVARLRRMLDAQGVPADAADPTPVAPPPTRPEATEGVRVIDVSPTDLDALTRVAQSEVGHFGKYGQAQLVGGLQAVAETVINRVAHVAFPDDIQSVINQRFQFSAINTTGSWTGLKPGSAAIEGIIRAYLEHRAQGANGQLAGATHFLNPFLSSPTALTQWGNHVVANAVATFGDAGKKDVHYHGFAPGTVLPTPHMIRFGAVSSGFDARSKAAAPGPMGTMRRQLLATLTTELDRFDNGRHKEDAATHFARIGDYWAALGLPYHGRSVVTFADGSTGNPAWSAAFISWALHEQGLDAAQFKGAQAHWVYFKDLVDARLAQPIFEVMDPLIYAPQPGDIVHYGRSTASKFDLAAAVEHLKIDGFYPSHSDFVVAVDPEDGTIRTVGGNVDNSVKAKRPKIDAAGVLKPRRSRGEDYPWISVLRLRDT
ncbi:DUF2272 domain-containing protein [Roseobacter sp.]|uniref:DUF2272 domain-containing protein n=1 Tax=Roseobacter sp. TaxID=1907202 RepID=UPI003297E2F9